MAEKQNETGMIDIASSRPVPETADRLESFLKSKGMKIFLRLDQAAEAAAVGLAMKPMILLLFGNPAAGTPMMIQYPSLAIDLPLKALVWESADGVRVSYNGPQYLQKRHGLETPPFANLGALMEAAVG
jgi:uncharacterized protein (DUF302 family)